MCQPTGVAGTRVVSTQWGESYGTYLVLPNSVGSPQNRVSFRCGAAGQVEKDLGNGWNFMMIMIITGFVSRTTT